MRENPLIQMQIGQCEAELENYDEALSYLKLAE
jgi:hypothetical protein